MLNLQDPQVAHMIFQMRFLSVLIYSLPVLFVTVHLTGTNVSVICSLYRFVAYCSV